MYKILHIITSAGQGGAERQLSMLINNSHEHFKHSIISLQEPGWLNGQIDPHLCKVINFDFAQARGTLWSKVWQLSRIIEEESPHLVQTWLYHADLVGWLANRLARGRRPLLWNLRCANMNLQQYSMRTRFVFWCNKMLSGFVRHCIVNSKAGHDFHYKQGFRPKHWDYIPNGYDTKLFSPNNDAGAKLRQALNIPGNAFIIGMVARLDPSKDYKTFMDACNRFGTRYEKAHFIVAGRGTENLEAPSNELSPRWHALGERDDLPQLYNVLDLGVLSSMTEGMPNVVGEMMASGTPCITTEVGDALELVYHGLLLIKPRNSEELYNAMCYYYGLPDKSQQMMQDKCRKHIMDNFSLPQMVRRYQFLYHQLITLAQQGYY